MSEPPPTLPPTLAPTLAGLTRAFLAIGLLSFGGPAAQIALMHRVAVEERGWLDEGQFLRALNFCMLLPGPEAQQLATYIGWRLKGWRGGVIAGGLFVLPGALVMLALSIAYVLFAGAPLVGGLFFGIKAAVLAIVLEALIRVSRRVLKPRPAQAVALAALLAVGLFALPFPLVVAAAALAGALLFAAVPEAPPAAVRPAGAGLWPAAIAALLWLAPLGLIAATLGAGHVLFEIGAFFAKLAVVTFGGAYAILAYLAEQAVGRGWADPADMLAGLGLAETTPGPLILVTQFAGFLGAYRAPAPFAPLAAGLLGAAVTTWVTFAPSFLWIFAGAPWLETLQANRRLAAALRGITAAVVGVMAHLAAWFALHTLFATVGTVQLGPVRLLVPDPASFDARAAALAAIAMGLVFVAKRGLIATVAIMAGLGVLASLF
ncbi:chromate efflux transporter [Blastochloris sulfoviridis]|uniref:Chromate efflux transporter n=1 Tax=Blastochloris sulfoviridis TaxID=50712 RepID=A0A5M6I2Z2_9HYPH|nr:chromate efflux transporter [Blastochloris sulfoviridis]KAA5602566.1 chromate efflux transporter [Blastochloris sulfoviridis]